MKLNDYGAFFLKKQDNSIWYGIYFKTNYLLKKIPTFNEKPNTIFAVFFDKDGRDYINHSISLLKFKAMLKINPKKSESDKSDKKAQHDNETIVELYDYNDNTAAEIYTKMHASGMNKIYTKQWFEKQYKFIKGQIAAYE
uniref:Uncharacterized protein n=1 Tax=viral metagenome TaxID=1070528 RepID=A0A6C0HMS0_9ZZZZ